MVLWFRVFISNFGEMIIILILSGTLYALTRYMMVFSVVDVCMPPYALNMPWTLSRSILCPTRSRRKRQRRNRLLRREPAMDEEYLRVLLEFLKRRVLLEFWKKVVAWLLLIIVLGSFLGLSKMFLEYLTV